MTSDSVKSPSTGVERVIPDQRQEDIGKSWVPCSDKPVQGDPGVNPTLGPVGQGPKPKPRPDPAQDGK